MKFLKEVFRVIKMVQVQTLMYVLFFNLGLSTHFSLHNNSHFTSQKNEIF